MKQRVAVLVAVCLALFCAVMLAACTVGPEGGAHIHTLVYHAEQAPDCTHAGRGEYWECTGCHALFGDEAMTEPYEEIPVLPATGIHAWNDAYTCTVCGAVNVTDGLQFDETDDLLGGSYALTGTGGKSGVIVLPAEYNGKPVTRIAAGAVGEGVTRVVLPANEYIYFESGAIAAAGAEICFRGSADEWAGYVFESGWNSGAELYLLNAAGSGFEKATSLTLNAERIAACAFQKLELAGVSLGGDAEYVGAYAFAESGLREAALGGITVLGTYAFYGCTALAEVTLSEGMTEINTGTFAFCTSLQTLRLPAGIRSVGANAFAGCEFTSVTYGGTREQWALVSVSGIGNDALASVVCEG